MRRLATAFAVLAFQCVFLGSDTQRPAATAIASARMSGLPPLTLWSWQRAEDLRAINRKSTAIAYLDQTVKVGASVEAVPRTQAFAFPAGSTLIPVVRIEVQPGADLGSRAQRKVAELITRSASRPGSAALQIDFDATRSQRNFYREILFSVRHRIPQNMPLSITALVSWCSYDDWIGGLPVDEAVPMLFRMGPDARRIGAAELRIVEPLCSGSVGVSTHEPWPEEMSQKRTYVFADRGWNEDFHVLGDGGLQ
jgi:Protein of unknown function (DUF3142)